jgi:hypothetical protein
MKDICKAFGISFASMAGAIVGLVGACQILDKFINNSTTK